MTIFRKELTFTIILNDKHNNLFTFTTKNVYRRILHFLLYSNLNSKLENITCHYVFNLAK